MNHYRDFIIMRSRKILGGFPNVHSPCLSVCQIDPDSGYCLGCWRTLDEVATWSQLDVPSRLAVWASIQRRALDSAAREAGQGEANPAPAAGAAAAAEPPPDAGSTKDGAA